METQNLLRNRPEVDSEAKDVPKCQFVAWTLELKIRHMRDVGSPFMKDLYPGLLCVMHLSRPSSSTHLRGP